MHTIRSLCNASFKEQKELAIHMYRYKNVLEGELHEICEELIIKEDISRKLPEVIMTRIRYLKKRKKIKEEKLKKVNESIDVVKKIINNYIKELMIILVRNTLWKGWTKTMTDPECCGETMELIDIIDDGKCHIWVYKCNKCGTTKEEIHNY